MYLSDPLENPVVTKDFLLTHNAEILCGPIEVSKCVDLSGQAANITLTSPALLACKGRSFLIHIKAFPFKNDQPNNSKVSCKLESCLFSRFI